MSISLLRKFKIEINLRSSNRFGNRRISVPIRMAQLGIKSVWLMTICSSYWERSVQLCPAQKIASHWRHKWANLPEICFIVVPLNSESYIILTITSFAAPKLSFLFPLIVQFLVISYSFDLDHCLVYPLYFNLLFLPLVKYHYPLPKSFNKYPIRS